MVVRSTRDESETSTTLEIEVPAEDVERTYNAILRSFAERASMPGFRRGHVPQHLVVQRFAGQIREEVLERLLPGAVSSAIEEKNLVVLGSPRVGDLEDRDALVVAEPHGDVGAGRRVHERVLDQVGGQPVEVVGDPVDDRPAAVPVGKIERQPVPDGDRRGLRRSLAHDLGEVHLLAQALATRVGAREQEQVGHEPAHAT